MSAWHLYVLNALNGLMNTVQQPANEVAATLLIPKEYYQKTSGLRSFSQSLNSILTPILATALFIRIPESKSDEQAGESLLESAKKGLVWTRQDPLIPDLILFLSCINPVASTCDAALPAMILPKQNGGETVLGLVNTCAGIATLAGSLLVTLLPAPRDRVRMICITLFIFMSTENFLLGPGHSPVIWCIGAILGWIVIPLINANMDVILRSAIPVEMQGRVYSCRNTLQFFTIPSGFLPGGLLVDKVCEPFMAEQSPIGVFSELFGRGKGSWAALLFFVIGVIICLIFSLILQKYRWSEDTSA